MSGNARAFNRRCVDFITGGEPFEWATSLAYRDFCRTLRLGGHDSGPMRASAESILKRHISDALARPSTDRDEYDGWHKGTCHELRESCASHEVDISVGQAQKWVNMAWKYLYVWDEVRAGGMGVAKMTAVLHVPLDSVILQAAADDLGVERPWREWSKIDDYDAYLAYQQRLREAIERLYPGRDPILWEFDAWQRER
jgi:hypothetical protein